MSTIEQGVPARVVIADPEKPVDVRYVPPAVPLKSLNPNQAVSTFSITYYAAGEKDPWNTTCYAFPASAKTAFSAAAAIWADTIQSTVPISIKACWASLSGGVLGYSGGGPIHRNFTGAKRTATWYMGSLANALHGSDMSANPDMYITYNKNFSWYYGTSGTVPAGQYDLMSVVLHEIGHGLNFAGSMTVSGGKGYYGYGYTPTNPNIYDVKMKNNAGTYLTSIGNGTTALYSALTSGVKYWGTYAMSANAGSAVKIYAPTTWAGGSSYSHLDYTTFNETANELMVYAISSGEAIHDPGPVAKGLLRDIGWNMKATGGFYSTFTTNYTGWTKRAGANWYIYTGGYLYTDGLSNKWSSMSKETTSYSNFEYSARIKRLDVTGDNYYGANTILLRGNPTTVNADYSWKNVYQFGYTAYGTFSVYKCVNGSWYALKPWTASAYINKTNWNELKVIATGSALKFLINGHLVWSGTDTSFSSGKVGLAMYRKSVIERMYVNWARLTLLSPGATSASGAAPSVPVPEELRIVGDDEANGRTE